MKITLTNFDRRTALQAGIEVEGNPVIEVKFSELPEDVRLALVSRLQIAKDGSASFGMGVAAPSLEAVLAVVAADEERIALARTRTIDAYNRAEKAWASAQLEPCDCQAYLGGYDPTLAVTAGEYGSYRGWRLPKDLPVVEAPRFEGRNAAAADRLIREAYARACEAEQTLRTLRDQWNAELLQAAIPAMLAGAHAAKKASDEAYEKYRSEKEAEQAARAAKRLETGYWTRETCSYNTRREGKPWCAKVTGVDARGKLVYEWGEWTGRPGDGGLLRIACHPGEIIAFGQKDLRNPHKSEHELRLMLDDGSMKTLDVIEAANLARGFATA